MRATTVTTLPASSAFKRAAMASTRALICAGVRRMRSRSWMTPVTEDGMRTKVCVKGQS